MTQADTVYAYDGSFEGMLCCIFAAFERKEEPMDIAFMPETLLCITEIETRQEYSDRVERGIKKDLGNEVWNAIICCYLSKEYGAEKVALQLVRRAYRLGGNLMKNLNDPVVFQAFRIAKSVGAEKHRMIEFLRFSDYNGNLVAIINPKHYILPLLSEHFSTRFPNENFAIYDEVHGAVLTKTGKTVDIIAVDEFVLPEVSADEQKFRTLWKLFYDTVEIKERRNHKLRMQHLPKRFWKNITELVDEA